MNEQLKNLYQAVILKNNNEPFHFEKREEARYILEAYNQICGDRFKLYFEIDKDKLSQIYFHGFGCAISKASTSVLVKKAEGKSIEEVQATCKSFLEMINGVEEKEKTRDTEILAFAAAKDFPGRIKCASLAWEVLDKWIEKSYP